MRKIIYKLNYFLFFLLLLSPFQSNAADYYWVGGSGNWSDYANHWATTSGGSSFHTQIPTSADNVFFDANSFSVTGQTVTIDQTIVSCKNMTWTGVTNTPQFTSSAVTNALNIYGSLTFVSGMSVGSMGPVNFLSTTTGNTVTTAGLYMNTNFIFSGAGGGWTLSDDVTLGSGIYNDKGIFFYNGSLNTNGKTLTIGVFNSDATNIRTLTLGSSVINIGYHVSAGWKVSGTGLTLNAGTSTINITNNAGFIPIFLGGGKTYHNLHFTGASSMAGRIDDGGNIFNGDVSFAARGDVTQSNTFNGTTVFYKGSNIQGDNTFKNLTFSPGFTYTIANNKTQTVNGTFSAAGSCSLPIILSSDGAQPATLSKSSGTVTADYITLTNITATGGAVFTANNATDGGGNSGWTINLRPSQDLYWIGGTGNWSDGNHWSVSSGGAPFGCTPGEGDNVFFDANSFSASGQTVTINATTAKCKNMDWTGANAPKLDFTAASGYTLYIYGSLTLTPGMTFGDYTLGNFYFVATTTGNTVNTFGLNMNTSFVFSGTGSWTLQDDVSLGSGVNNDKCFYFYGGSLNTNGKTITVGKFDSYTTNTRTLTLGSSTINVSYGANYGWRVDGTGLTLNAGTSTINMTNNSGGWNPNFYGGGKTYHNLHFTGASVTSGRLYDTNTFTGDLTFASGGYLYHGNTVSGNTIFYGAGYIYNNNTFNNLTFSPGFSYTIANNKTQTINGIFSAAGTCSLPIILSSDGAQSATISKSSGAVTVSHVTLTNVAATGGATFTANASTDGGGNSGWTINGSSSAQDLYWIGGTGNWNDGNHWSVSSGGAPFGCIPGEGDNVFFDANSFSVSGQTVTINATTAKCKNMNWTGANAPKLDFTAASGYTLYIYGSLTLAPGMTFGDYTLGNFYFVATTTGNTVNTFGLNMNTSFIFSGVGGGWTLQDDISLGSGVNNEKTIYLDNGSLNTNNKTITAGKFISTGNGVRTLTLDSSTINVEYRANYGWQIDGTNINLDAGTSTINLTCDAGGMIPVFYGGGKTYFNLSFTGISTNYGKLEDGGNTFNGNVTFASKGLMPGGNTIKGTTTFYKDGDIQSSNTFNNLIFSPGNTYTLAAGKTQTITGLLTISGTGSYPVRIQSGTPGSPAVFHKDSGIVCADYIRLSDNTATGAAFFYAGDNSEDMGGNTGWSFTTGSGAPAGVTVTATPPGSICSGTPVQFSALPVNGGDYPIYEWKKNGTDIGIHSPVYSDSTLKNNDVISCTMTSSAGCVSAAPVTDSAVVSVVVGATAGIITAQRDTICEGTPAGLQLSGSSGAVQWQSSFSPTGFTDISGADTTTYSEVLSADTYFRVVAGTGTCADTSAALKITVNPSPVADFNFTTMGTQVSFTDNSTGATVYEWDFGDGQNSAEQNPVHDYAATGAYHVCLNVFNGSNCSFTICKEVDLAVGMATVTAGSRWKLYPNPVKNMFTLSGENIQSVTAVELYDVLGSSRFNKNFRGEKSSTLQVNISGLPEGTYFLRIITEEANFIQPIIKMQ